MPTRVLSPKESFITKELAISRLPSPRYLPDTDARSVDYLIQSSPDPVILIFFLKSRLFVLNPHPRICLLILEKGEGRERERKETTMFCLQHRHGP